MKLTVFSAFVAFVVNTDVGSGKEFALRDNRISRHLEDCADPCGGNDKKVYVCHYLKDDDVYEELCIGKRGSVRHMNRHENDYCGQCLDIDVCGSWPCENRGLCTVASSSCDHGTGTWSECEYLDVQCDEGQVCVEDSDSYSCVAEEIDGPCDDMEVWTLGSNSVKVRTWVQVPYSGDIIEENGGLKLIGSAKRTGNRLLSKEWYNLERASVYFKWQAGPEVATVYYTHGVYGFFGGLYQYGIPPSTDMYTKMKCDVDADKCESWTSTGNYIDQGGTLWGAKKEWGPLSDSQKDKLKRAQIHFGFSDNYGGTPQFGLLLDGIVVDSSIVAKPTTTVPMYNGESTIPPTFTSTSSTTCVWDVVQDESVNVIKGSWFYGQGANECSLNYDFSSHPLVKGISFSIKTEVNALENYFHAAGMGVPDVLWTNSGSDWKSYCLPLPTPSWTSITWLLKPSAAYFTDPNGSEHMYLKDIKLLVDE